jgi:hypothetical protein
VLAWFKPNFPLTRHSHNIDCLYYVLSGSAIMGNRTLRAGDSFFVPADAPYKYLAGPEGVEVLEIRVNVDTIDMTCYDDPDVEAKRVAAAVEENRTLWASLPASPTFVANAGLSANQGRPIPSDT